MEHGEYLYIETKSLEFFLYHANNSYSFFNFTMFKENHIYLFNYFVLTKTYIYLNTNLPYCQITISIFFHDV